MTSLSSFLAPSYKVSEFQTFQLLVKVSPKQSPGHRQICVLQAVQQMTAEREEGPEQSKGGCV